METDIEKFTRYFKRARFNFFLEGLFKLRPVSWRTAAIRAAIMATLGVEGEVKKSDLYERMTTYLTLAHIKI